MNPSSLFSTATDRIRQAPLAQVAGIALALLGTASCSSGSSNATPDAAASSASAAGNSGGSTGQAGGAGLSSSSASGGSIVMAGTGGSSNEGGTGGTGAAGSTAAGGQTAAGGSETTSGSAGMGGGATTEAGAGGGGSTNAGGVATGGGTATSLGGTKDSTGGVATNGGTASSLGGNSATAGGTTGAGGLTASGGKAYGGTKTAGGTPATGGTIAMGGVTAPGGVTATAGSTAAGTPPGDIAAKAGTPLVAAHSMTRALYAAYSGKLFQVRRASDGKTQDIGVTAAGGSVDMAALNTFCSGTTCSVSLLYDQSGISNDLPQATPANQPTIAYWSTSDGAKLPMAVTVSKQWLRNRTATKKIPTGSASQTEYFVVHGNYFNSKCCYDYGNMETTIHDDGAGTMSALYFGSSTDWTKGAGTGPWGMTDYENGLFAGAVKDPGGTNPNYPSLAYPGNNLITVLTKSNGTTSWALKAGNAATGPLNTYWNGALPSGYSPLKQQGGLSLGEGGDGSNLGSGAFSEGVVIAAVTSDATDDLIQANLVSVYGR
jgi:hypothetical protein